MTPSPFVPQHALVVGASGGIGSALAEQLRQRGAARVSTLSRSEDGLDLQDEDCIVRALDTLPDEPLDLVFIATGVLSLGTGPEKRLRALDRDQLTTAMQINAIGPALVIKHVADRLVRPGRAVVAALSARVGSIGDNRLGGWYGYRASKAALNQLVHGAAIEIGRKRPDAVVVSLHPGTIDTPLTKPFARHYTATPDECATQLLNVLDGLSPDDSGGFYDYAGEVVPW